MAGKAKEELTKEQKSVIEYIGKRVRDVRKSKNMTQEELAANSNMSVVNLIAIERGVRNFSVSTLFDILKALDVSIEAFFNL